MGLISQRARTARPATIASDAESKKSTPLKIFSKLQERITGLRRRGTPTSWDWEEPLPVVSPRELREAAEAARLAVRAKPRNLAEKDWETRLLPRVIEDGASAWPDATAVGRAPATPAQMRRNLVKERQEDREMEREDEYWRIVSSIVLSMWR